MSDLSDLEPNERLDVAAYVQHVRKMGDEDLLHAKKLVLELVEHPGWVLVQEIIAKAVDASTARMRYADPKDPATMWRDIGVQAGMDSQRQVTRAILEVSRRREERIAEQVRRREGAAETAEA